jgi:hypothetical protein
MAAFRPYDVTTVAAVTATTAAFPITLNSLAPPIVQVRAYNAGPGLAFIGFRGTATVTTGMPLPPGAVEIFTLNGDQRSFGLIAASGTTATVYLTPGSGD